MSYLYMSARLVELPLGVFAIALSTILFPQLSRAISLGDEKNYNETFFKGLRIIIMLTLPSAVGLHVLGDLIIKTLFEWKEFGGEIQPYLVRFFPWWLGQSLYMHFLPF